MKKNIISVAFLSALLSFGATAIAAEYEITVDMDETTSGDMDMVETFLESANGESVPSRSLRRVLMGGSGELATAADARFDAYGSLMLDDGSMVQFMDEDILKVRKKICNKRRLVDGQCGNATISFKCKIVKGSHRKCQPSSIQVCPEAGGNITVRVPPASTKGGVEICNPSDGIKLCRRCIHK